MTSRAASNMNTSAQSPVYLPLLHGQLPQGWKQSTLRELAYEPMQNGVFYRPEDKGKGIGLINVGDLYRSAPIKVQDLGLFNADTNDIARFSVRPGDLFFTRSSIVPSGIAYCNWFNTPSTPIVFDSHVIRFRPDANKVLPEFLFRYCTSAKARMFFVSHAKSGTMTTIDQGVLGNCPVWLPPRSEQEAIAEALSDADALIESLEALIAKKRVIKQGAMQDLLSGRKRLPGFSAEWVARRFGGLATIRNQKISTLGNSRAAFCVELENVGSNTGRLLDFSDATRRVSSKYIFQEGDVLFGRLRPYLRKFWQADREGVCSTEIWPLMPSNSDLQPDYLYQIIQTDGFIEAAGSSYGTHMPRSDWKALGEYEFTIPTDTDEQQAIATMLAEMDSEVESLEAKLAKARQIKQGMMQELLTGRVRLV